MTRVLPFEPKSTSKLLPGDFWAIPLQCGHFGCGRVIQIKEFNDGRRDSRLFLAGLLDWFGNSPPDELTIAGRNTVIQGQAHIRTIQRSGGMIIGHRSLALDAIAPDLMLSHSSGHGAMLQCGFACLRPATEQESASLPVFSTFGYDYMASYAEHHLVAARARS